MSATPHISSAAVPAGDPAGIDASARAPIAVLFGSAAVWLVVASVLGLIASIKFHSPTFLADSAWLTYGRVYAVAKNALLYGFALQAALGVVLWIIAQLSERPVSQPWYIFLGGKLWNLGVLVGVVAIFMGHSTGFENLEMPHAAAVILFLGYLLIGIWTLHTMHLRRRRQLEPSQWFFFAGLLWFPWIYSTAYLLLTVWPVRGMTQAVINWWYSGNLFFVCFALLGLGIAFHFIQRLMNRRLHSEYLALFTFWTVMVFASWTGIPASAPVPAWIPAFSTVATIMMSIPLLSVIMNVCQTCGRGCSGTTNPPPGKFIAFGLMAFVAAWLMAIVGALPGVSPFTNLTWYGVAQSQLNVYGFFSMTLFGAIYYIAPRVMGMEWPKPGWVKTHYWIAAAGILLIVVPLAVGGVMQGMKLNNPPADFIKVTLHFLRVATIGELLILLGHLLFLFNVLGLLTRFARARLAPVCASMRGDLKTAEVKP